MIPLFPHFPPSDFSLASGKIFSLHPVASGRSRARIRRHPANEMCTMLTRAHNIFFPRVLFPAPQHAPSLFLWLAHVPWPQDRAPSQVAMAVAMADRGLGLHPAKREAYIRQHPACRMPVESLSPIPPKFPPIFQTNNTNKRSINTNEHSLFRCPFGEFESAGAVSADACCCSVVTTAMSVQRRHYCLARVLLSCQVLRKAVFERASATTPEGQPTPE